ncbi:MAG TPA: hypothetical protein EYH41_15170 [Novosphingobium capsulatum]|nr:hypothetical protein [Novosphingobium capsulatum]
MADRTRSTEPVSRTAIVGNVVALPGAAAHRVRQPRGGATVAYRKAHPWPGQWYEPTEPVDLAALAFTAAYCAAKVANARWKLAEAVANEAHHLGDASAHESARAAYWRDFVAMRAAIERLAATPAPDSRKLTAKANAIGGIWLGAEGAWYDGLRASIERDAVRLGVTNPAPSIAKRQRGG